MTNEQQKAFWEVIQALNEMNILKHVMVIGSWAEYLYPNILGEEYEPNIRTRDVDLFYWNIHEPKEIIKGFVTKMSEKGFLYDEDFQSGVGRFYKEDLIEIEFLTQIVGSQEEKPYKIDALNIKADSLRVLNLLAEYPLNICVNGYDLIVPEPSAFVLQKMLALPNRVPTYKKEKDVEAIREILIYIKKDERQRELLEHIYSKVIANKKKKKILDGIISEYKIDIITE